MAEAVDSETFVFPGEAIVPDSHGVIHTQNMALSRATAAKRAKDFLLRAAADSIELRPVQSLPGAVYDFDPSGWLLFAVHRRDRVRVGGGEYVGVHAETGEVRHLGMLGE